MDPTTLRLPEDLATALSEEARELGYSSRAEYIRHILRNRSGTEPATQSDTGSNTSRSGSGTGSNTDRSRTDTGPATDEIGELVDVVEDLADRVADLERAHEIAGHERQRTPARESGGRSEGIATHRSGDTTATDTAAGDDAGSETLRDRMETELYAVDVPGRKDSTVTTRRDAIRFAWDYLREHETAESREIANATFREFEDDDALGYSESSRYPGYGLWDNCVRDALKQLPGVNAPGERGKNWRFDPE